MPAPPKAHVRAPRVSTPAAPLLPTSSLSANVIHPQPVVNGLQLILTTPEQLQQFVDLAVAKALRAATNNVPRLLDMKSLCRELGISAPTARKMIDQGCPFVICGELKKFDLATVTAWLNRGAQ